MKNKLSLFFIFFLIFPIILLSGFFWWKWATAPVDKNNTEEKNFIITKGEETDQIIRRLKFEGFLKSTLAFKLLLRKENLAGKIQAGDFRLSPSMNAREIAGELIHGTVDLWVTVKEGLRKEEIFKVFADSGFALQYDKWLEATEEKEGYLFPDTYLVPKDASISAIIKIMTDNFEKKVSQITKKATLKDIILASLVEREAKLDQDRNIVAGILVKRIENDWPLEIDATVQYAQATKKCSLSKEHLANDCWWPKVFGEDLELESPYNTYKNKGLPPKPICNPSLSSIEAAVFPKNSDYWFYLSDIKGNLHYARTLEEHEENIRKYLTP